MRIIEPENSKRGFKVQAGGQYGPLGSSEKSRRIGLYTVIIFALLGIAGVVFYFNQSHDSSAMNNSAPVVSNNASSPTTTPKPTEKPATADGAYRVFTGEEFRVLYNNFAYPGTKPIVATPIITGNEAADQRLRAMAEARGYRLRDLVDVDLFPVDNQKLQEAPAKDFADLKTAAAADGVSMIITSGFRSQDDQKALFLGRLYASGISAEDIAEGTGDDAAQKVMQVTAPPGYSRHHTGYVIDLGCGNKLDAEFVDTICYTWISKDNYLNAKKFGWIPSYPQDTVFQGPEPEPWEYVWVGADVLR